ncbi:MAG: hypothetical protein Q4D62_12945 [Planctomycetia bacterium]|nr:hypothetical protein [Planctomycetia bacterium]
MQSFFSAVRRWVRGGETVRKESDLRTPFVKAGVVVAACSHKVAVFAVCRHEVRTWVH